MISEPNLDIAYSLILWVKGGQRIELQVSYDRDTGTFTTRREPALILGDLVQTGFQVGRVIDLVVREGWQTFRLQHVCCYISSP